MKTNHTGNQVKCMEIKKSLKPMISIAGIILLMMTAASVSAEDTIGRDTQPTADSGMVYASDDNGANTEPMLIAPLDSADNATSGIPDYENYTGDMLISPGPTANSETTTPFTLPILGCIAAVILIGLVCIGIFIKRKQKK